MTTTVTLHICNIYEDDNEKLIGFQVGLGVIGIGTAATLAATFALAQQYGKLPPKNGNI